MNRFVCSLLVMVGMAACSPANSVSDPNAIEVTGNGEVAADIVGSYSGSAPGGEISALTINTDDTFVATVVRSCSATTPNCANLAGSYRLLKNASAEKNYLELVDNNGDTAFSFGYAVDGTQIQLADRGTTVVYTLARTK